jgi:exosortase
MGFGAHRRADGGGLLPRAGQAGDRLVADTRFLSRLPGAHFCGVLVWAKRRTLLDTRIAPTWSGIAVIALGLVVLLLGVYGAELFLSRVSLVILLAGLVLCFGGWQLLKNLRFVFLVLLLAIPIPSIIFNEITLPLQILASKLASALLPLFGVPVLREGNVIELPQ